MTVREVLEELIGAHPDERVRVMVCVQLSQGTQMTLEGRLNTISRASPSAPLVLGHLLLPEDIGDPAITEGPTRPRTPTKGDRVMGKRHGNWWYVLVETEYPTGFRGHILGTGPYGGDEFCEAFDSPAWRWPTPQELE